MAKLRVGILISGRGSNMRALLDAASRPDFPAEIALVLSNNHDAGGLDAARAAGIATAIVDHRKRSREDFEVELDQVLRRSGVEFICLAGFMRLLTAGFVNAWPDRILNIHPSLLPSFKGIHVHERALEAGVRFTGCTVHFVRPEMDDGPIVVQAAVPVHGDDDADRLAARVLEAEHRIYPLALRLVAEGRVVISGNSAKITGGVSPAGFQYNPEN